MRRLLYQWEVSDDRATRMSVCDSLDVGKYRSLDENLTDSTANCETENGVDDGKPIEEYSIGVNEMLTGMFHNDKIKSQIKSTCRSDTTRVISIYSLPCLTPLPQYPNLITYKPGYTVLLLCIPRKCTNST